MTDRLAPFGQAVLAVRWGTVAISLALASPEIADGDQRLLGVLGAAAAWAVLRTVRPLQDSGGTAGVAWILLEVVVSAGAVAATGYGESALVLTLLVPATLAGFARGFQLAGRVALAVMAAVAIPWVAFADGTARDLRDSTDWAVQVVLVALVAGYARLISGEAEQRREAALDRLGRLSDANVLLFQLHQITQTLPASLDLTEVLDATATQLRELFDADGVAIVLYEESDGIWHTVRRHGIAAPAGFTDASLPPPLTRAVNVRSTSVEAELGPAGGAGLDPRSRSGVYGVLAARGSTIGLVALEHLEPGHFTHRDVELVTGLVDAAALAVDNARWFGRLRTVGADEERSRIARDLHDRTGQSLAYLAFELDRLTRQSSMGKDVTTGLDELRTDVRKVVAELRDTLYDLRTEVTESHGLAATLEDFLQRVGRRSGLETELDAAETARLPVLRERELWRIARDALTSAERDAGASRISVSFRCDGHRAELEIADDGRGFDADTGGSLGSQRLAALRERAASIGASLAVVAEPDGGTRVRCTLVG